MNTWSSKSFAWMFGFGFAATFAACGASPADPRAALTSGVAASTTPSGSTQHAEPAASSATQPSAAAGASAPARGAAGSSAQAASNANMPADGNCAASLAYKKEGCPCHTGDTAACWTGPTADRNVGKCHDGLQICTADGEFGSWGPCMGVQLDCGTPDAGTPPPTPHDAGTPPPPPPDCSCIPGAIIQCSEDCTTGIICSLTATKKCLPDGTWSVCREDTGVMLDLPGVQCRNMLHGCLDVLDPAVPGAGQNEAYVGDCSTQFKCGHAPSTD